MKETYTFKEYTDVEILDMLARIFGVGVNESRIRDSQEG